MAGRTMFRATAIKVGRCERISCECVHLELYDKNGVVRAQALIPLETVDAVVKEMISWRDGKPGIGHPISSKLH